MFLYIIFQLANIKANTKSNFKPLNKNKTAQLEF